MKKITKIIFICLVSILLSSNAFSQGSPEALKAKALSQMDLAKEFSNRAQEVVTKESPRDDFVIARYLYTEAAKLYETARRNFLTLEKYYYVGKEYAESAAKSVEICMTSIGLCSKRITNMS
ncbi:MAG: hypothetical protein HQL29_05850 [Candidatus Omnitrophica bacterium]|nr:hypothetical protein [Candidatus Omnitrophota bacterium]